MKTYIDPVMRSRIQHAWKQLSPAQRARLEPLVYGSQRDLQAIAVNGRAPEDSTLPHQALLLHTALTDDSDQTLSGMTAGVVFDVTGVGEIWGTGKFQQLDPGWAECLAEWLEHLVTGNHAFNNNPPVVNIPDSVTIAIAGDWGTGNWQTAADPTPSAKVAAQIIALQPQITIHLGDVYYSGTAKEEQHLLQDPWPEGSIGAFTLNSNHEMYSGDAPYFGILASPRFQLQRGCSYFALENTNWVIVALDSAYYSDREQLYKDGVLFSNNGPRNQLDFLRAQVAKGKKILVLTHHHGLAPDASGTTTLWDQVMGAFPANSGPSYWYWGHVHVAAVYAPYGTANILCRCCGHGALPWGQATSLSNQRIQWYEHRIAGDPEVQQRVYNGFAFLALNGAALTEKFYDENGGIAWQ